MKRYYYITFNWNRTLFYDGYFVRKDNGMIIGVTDDWILAGDRDKIVEFAKPTGKIYLITGEMFEENASHGDFTVRGQIKHEYYTISIKSVSNIDENTIRRRIDVNLPKLPLEMQEIFIENYLKRG